MLGHRTISLSPASPTDLTTVADAKAYMGVTHSDDDTLIGALITVATGAIEDRIDGVVTQRTVTETIYRHDWDGVSDHIVLSHAPVTALTSITIDDASQTVSDYDVASAGVVFKKEGGAISGRKIVVVYTAGWATPPDTIVTACKALVRDLYQDRQRSASIASEELRDVGQVTYATGGGALGVSGEASWLLQSYRRAWA